MNVPKIDGLGILHLIRKDEKISTIPFILLSKKDNYEDFRKAMEAGADDCIVEPFDKTILLNSIENRLKRVADIRKNILYETDKEQHPDALDSKKAMQNLFDNQLVNKYTRRQIIFLEGNQPHYLYYVQKGKVKGFKTDDKGKDLTILLYGEGDFIGFAALIEDGVYQVSAEAMEDCEIILIPKEEFLQLIKTNNAVATDFIRMLVKNNNQKAERMVQLAYNSLRKRVADALLLLRNKFTKGKENRFSLHITREELANIPGTSTESLIRTLSDFRAEKLIDIQGKTIEILDEAKLENMIN